MKKTIGTLFLIILTIGLHAQGIAKDWYGTLILPSTTIHLVFHVTGESYTYKTIVDSPDQGVNGLPTDSTKVVGNQITIFAGKYGITYTGTFLPDSNKINGTFKQGEFSTPLSLFPTKNVVNATATMRRPQDPKDFPYRREDVKFVNPIDKDTLAGTLTMPSDGKASRIVILITGSGPQNRNEELLGHRPFLVWSDWLTRNGIAVLRYDDRGIANSTGNFYTCTTADFADDVEAAVRYIKSRDDLKGLSIGLMGHSEGGLIAPIVAAKDKDVKFIVLLAGPGIPIVDLMLKQNEEQARLEGDSQDSIAKALVLTKAVYRLIVQNPALSTAALKMKMDTLLYNWFKLASPAQLDGKTVDETVTIMEKALLSPWYRYFLAMNPQDNLDKVKCPVLAINGSLDMQVNAEANLAGIKKALAIGGNKHVEVDELTGLNHLFQQAKTGSVAEYSEIQETVDPIALNKVSEWINHL